MPPACQPAEVKVTTTARFAGSDAGSTSGLVSPNPTTDAMFSAGTPSSFSSAATSVARWVDRSVAAASSPPATAAVWPSTEILVVGSSVPTQSFSAASVAVLSISAGVLGSNSAGRAACRSGSVPAARS